MEFADTRFAGYAGNVVFVDTAAGQQDDASVGLCLQFFQQGNTLFGSGLCTRSKNAVATQLDEGLQCLLGLAAYVEGTVKGDRHALRGFEQLLHQGDVDIAFGRQAAEDYSVGSQPAGVSMSFNMMRCSRGV